MRPGCAMGDGPWQAMIASKTQMEKDQGWFLAHAYSAKSLGDHGHLFDVQRHPLRTTATQQQISRPGTASSSSLLLSSASEAELRASLPLLSSSAPSATPSPAACGELIDTRDFTSTTHSIHKRILAGQPRMAGARIARASATQRRGRSCTSRSSAGAAEALGMLSNKYERRPATAGASSMSTSSSSVLRRSPSQQELDALLRRRSRARARRRLRDLGRGCAAQVVGALRGGLVLRRLNETQVEYDDVMMRDIKFI